MYTHILCVFHKDMSLYTDSTQLFVEVCTTPFRSGIGMVGNQWQYIITHTGRCIRLKVKQIKTGMCLHKTRMRAVVVLCTCITPFR